MITSFNVDHDFLEKGFYLADETRGIYTYDLRFKRPNRGDYLSYGAIHTIEHLFAVDIRTKSEVKDAMVYFGPMGCRTGFYLLLTDIPYEKALKATYDCLKKMDFSSIPGATRQECGNYLEHDIKDAEREVKEYIKVLDGIIKG